MITANHTTGALLARRALAEKATPGPWENVFLDKERVVIDHKGTVICDCEMEDHFDDRETKIQFTFNPYHIAANDPTTVMADIDEILRLRAEVERLEKEADCLAERACATDCIVADVACFREAARKAVEECHE